MIQKGKVLEYQKQNTSLVIYFSISVVIFQSPRPGDEAPKVPGNLVDDTVPRTAAEVPEIDEDSSQVLATEPKDTTSDIDNSSVNEFLEMAGGEIVDDLTDSQLCAMDWSSQLPQEPWYINFCFRK